MKKQLTFAILLFSSLSGFAQVTQENLEKEIKELTTEKETVTEKLNNGNTPFDELQKLSLRIGEITLLLDEKEFRWLELSEIQI